MKRNILLLTTDSHIGGTEKTIALLIKHLNKEHYQPFIAVLKSEGELAETYKEYTADSIFLEMKSLFHAFRIRRLVKFIKRNNITVVHSFLFHANITARLLKCMCKDLLVINAHRTMEKGAVWHVWLDRITKRYADHETANAEAVKAFYCTKTGVPPENVSVLYNGVESDDPQSEKRSVNDQLTFGCLGSFGKAKGQFVLLKAFERCIRKNLQARLIFVGEGPLQKICVDYAEKAHLAPYIRFHPKKNNIKQYYNMLDCVIIPSLWEGLPNVCFEALNAGCVLIATNVGGICEIAQGLGNVVFVKPNDIQDMSRAIEYVAAHYGELSAHRHEGSNRIAERFSVSAMMRQYEAFYDSITRDRQR